MPRYTSAIAMAAVLTAGGVATAQADILIGTAGPMTGQYAVFGDQMTKGAEMAVADINAAGGVLGETVVLGVYDDACDSTQAVEAANRAVGDGVVFMAGHFCSSSSIPASEVYTEEGVLQISPASTNPALTDEGGDNVFRVCGRDDQQGLIAGNYLAENYGSARIAFLHDKTAYGQGLADATLGAYQSAGGEEAMYEAYTPGESDYSALVTLLKSENIDVVYLGGYHTEGGLIIRQSVEQGYEPQLISGDALVATEFGEIAGPAGDGTLFTFSPDPRLNPNSAEVVGRFEADGFNPEGYTLYTYAAIQAWAQAANAADSTDVDDVIASLRTGSFDTVIGSIGFDDMGDVSAPGYVWYEWTDGDYAYAE